MQVIVNGKPREAHEGLTVLALLGELKLNSQTTVVELNRTVLDRESFGVKELSDGDRLELVRLVGGG
ncbi:MAG TPA: sulfur carrier protein ThiS [bacterium]|jgi:thiamine biosynthesis protein ThiS